MEPCRLDASVSPRSDANISSSRSRVKKRNDSAGSTGNTLACNHCRSKKIKCEFTPDGCQKCRKLRIACIWPDEDQRKNPSSKAHIKMLQSRIAQLEAALETVGTHTAGQIKSSHQPYITPPAAATEASTSPTPVDTSSSGRARQQQDNIISRLCRRQWQLNSDAEGQYKFFGPTSSLHLTESISVSILGTWGESSIYNEQDLWTITDIDLETQTHLLDLYWDYQHAVLQVFHKPTFLHGIETRQPKYVSKALLYCIFACAARISPRPSVRALALPRSDDHDLDITDDAQPQLIATAMRYLEEELKRPRLTTIQALLLMSVVYCALGRDTKGWLFTGDACRLAIDLGIHKNATLLTTSANLSLDDAHARQKTFWACVVFDRCWALYLGRPYCLKIDRLSSQNINFNDFGENAWEARMAFAWATLFETIGDICEALNGENSCVETLEELDKRLQVWHEGLDEALQYHQDCSPSLAVLHMQYSSAMILLHQPTARFGCRLLNDEQENRSAISRIQCVHYATEIARFLQDYRRKHGDASSLSGVSLHAIATAATTLVADVAERKRNPESISLEMESLRICVRTLGELETTYFVARRVRKIIQLIIRVCHLESEYLANHQVVVVTPAPCAQLVDTVGEHLTEDDNSDHQQSTETNSDMNPFLEAAIPSGYSPFAFDEFLPTSSYFDIFHTFDTETLTAQKTFQGLYR